MTAEEKQTVYTMLKTAADALCGYHASAFATEMPAFTDDTPVKTHTDTAASVCGVDAPMRTGEASTVLQTDASSEAFSPHQTVVADAHAGIPHVGTVIKTLAERIAACTRCPLAAGRTRTVPGTGVLTPAVVVVGEGPGHDEDIRGEPFVGPAGKLLDKMLAAVSLSRTANCFIANIVKCRPPNNRVPTTEEAAACEDFLRAQLLALRPAMILCAGSTAAKQLLKTSAGVTRLRGRLYDWNGIPVAVTYHPSALLRDARLKRPAWDDLKLMRAQLVALSPDYAAPFEAAHTPTPTAPLAVGNR